MILLFSLSQLLPNSLLFPSHPTSWSLKKKKNKLCKNYQNLNHSKHVVHFLLAKFSLACGLHLSVVDIPNGISFHSYCCVETPGTRATWAERSLFGLHILNYSLLRKQRQELKLGRNLGTGTDTETLKAYCLLVFSSWLPRSSFL